MLIPNTTYFGYDLGSMTPYFYDPPEKSSSPTPTPPYFFFGEYWDPYLP